MPFIQTKTSVKITNEQELALKTEFGKAITLLSKSESWLMLDFEDGCRMYFRGESGPMAMLSVSLFGKAGASAYDKLTAKLTQVVSDILGIPSDKIYIKYEEVSTWGYSGTNF